MTNSLAAKRQKGPGRAFAIPSPFYAVVFLALGFYLGSQRQLLNAIQDDPTPLSSSLNSFLSSQPPPFNKTTETKTQSVDRNDKSGAFRLHPTIHITQDPELYKELVHTKAEALVESGIVHGCDQNLVEPYLEILRNIEKDPLYYEDGNIANNQTCPLVFMFYFEGGSTIADTFFQYYSNIKTKRCLNFIVSRSWIDVPGTREMAESNGYKILDKHFPKQDKCISQNLYGIKETYGDDTLVSVNDLDHLLVWFDKNGTAHRYSTYTDMVRMYMVELLTTRGCSNQMVKEKYVVPCTCLMEDNQKYVSRHEEGVIWSEYGVTNRFHPTGNFYLDRKLARPSDGDSNYVYSIGTVFANLRKYEGDIITHHKIGYKSKKIFSNANMAGVIHARSDNMIQSLTKYHHFLLNSMRGNGFRDKKATIKDAMGCSIEGTHSILNNEGTCRKVKEFANILAIGHQKLACLNAGYSEEHCSNDFTCCLTYTN